jgi:type VI protein secretion system component Hcp
MSKVASLFLDLTYSPWSGRARSAGGGGEKPFLGEAKDAEYRDQIEINSWNWDVTQQSQISKKSPTGTASVPGPNTVVPSALKFTKTMCRATSGMLGAMRNGELLKAVFALEEDSDADFLLRVTLDRVRILEYDLNIDGPDVSESWKFNYETIRFDYRPNAREGELTAQLTRPPGASTDDPSAANSKEEKLLSQARALGGPALKPLMSKLGQIADEK